MTNEGYFNLFHAMQRPAEYNGDPDWYGMDYPWFQNCQAIKEGFDVLFMETAFEWELMSYYFYPYYWANRRQWMKLYQAEDADPVFSSFLEAGYGQVMVPIRPGFEDMVKYLLDTGFIWGGKGTPPISAQSYLELFNKKVGQQPPEGTTIGLPWTIKIPTNLVILQKNAEGIAGTGLPCDAGGI